MYCPKCSQLQVSEETQFCSGCGLPLNDLKEMISAAAKPKRPSKDEAGKPSPRQKGVRQGILLMLLSLILVPVYILLAPLFPPNDRLVESSVSDTPFEKISQAILLTIFLMGLVRTMYAYFFQRGAMPEEASSEVTELRGSSSSALPPMQNTPPTGFGAWRSNSGELVQTSSRNGPETK